MNFINALENISHFQLWATLQITATVFFYNYILSYLAEIISCGSVCVYTVNIFILAVGLIFEHL